MADQIIIELIGDPSGLKPAEEALKELSKVSQENMEAFNKANEAIKKFTESSVNSERATKFYAESAKDAAKELNGASDAATRCITAISSLNAVIAAGVARASAEEFKKFSIEITNLNNRKKDLEATMKKNAESMKQLTSEGKRVSAAHRALAKDNKALRAELAATEKALDNLIKGLNVTTKTTEKTDEKTNSFIGRLKAIRASLSSSGAAFSASAKKAAEYSDSIFNLLAHTKKLAGAIGEVGEAYAQASGDEGLSVEIKKKTAAALQAIATAQAVVTVATEASTVAAVAFDIATSPITGIALLIAAAIALLGAELYGVYKAFQFVISLVKDNPVFKGIQSAFHKISNAVQHGIDKLRDYASMFTGGLIDSSAVHKHKQDLEEIAKTHEKASKELKNQIDLMEAAGAKSSEIADKRKQQLADERTALTAQLELETDFEKKEELRNKLNENRAAQLKNQIDLVETIANESKEAGENEVTIAATRQKSYEILLNDTKASIDRLKASQNRTAEEQKELEALEISYQGLTNKKEEADKDYTDKRNAAYEKYVNDHLAREKQKADAALAITEAGSKEELDAKIKDINAAAAIEINSVKGFSAEAIKIREDLRAKAQKDAEAAKAEFNAKTLQDDKARIEGSLIEAKRGTQEEYDLKFQLFTKERDLIAANTSLSKSEKEKAYKEINQQEEAFDTDFRQRQTLSEINTQKSINQLKLLNEKEFSAESLRLKKDQIELELKEEIAAIDASDKKEEEKEAARNLARANATKKTDKEVADFAIHQSDEAVKKLEEKNNKTIEAIDGIKGKEKEKLQLELANIKIEGDANKDLLDKKIISLEEYAKRSEDTEKKLAAKKKELRKVEGKEAEEAAKKREETERKVAAEILKMAKEVSDAIFANQAQARQNELTEKLQTLDAQKNAELLNTTLTASQRNAIEKKYKAEEANEKLKAWKADQKAKEEQALINGLLAFTTALAATPYPAGLVTGLLALAQAGVQAGIIASKTPPKFATGTPGSMVTPAGMKWVGEQGPELIYTPGGEKIITNSDSIALLEKYRIPSMPNVDHLLEGTGVHMTGSIDYEKLGSVIAKNIPQPVKNNIVIDKNGFKVYSLGAGGSKEFLNNEISF